jgi:anaerobic selenocysteine-containing dehydrogenase
MLALSLAQVMLGEGLADAAGAAALGDRQALDAFAPERVAPEVGQANGVTADRIRQLARAFAAQRPSLAIGGGGAGAFTNGTETLVAILALNALAGSGNPAAAGNPGSVLAGPPLPVAGVPAPARVSSLADWQQLIRRLDDGLVDTVLVYDADPIHGLPAGIGLRDALRRAPFIASFSGFLDDTAALADLLLPSNLPLEDWGDDVPEPGSGVATLTVQQPVVQPIYDTQSFGDTLLALAGAIGGPVHDALPWATLKEAVQDGARAFWQLNRGSVQETSFERFWVRLLQQGGWWDAGAPSPGLAAPRTSGGAAAPAGNPSPQSSAPPAPGAAALAADPAALRQAIGRIGPPRFAGGDREFPFYLVVFPHNTLGRGETAHLPWLQATPDPVTSVVWQTWVEVNPSRARALGLKEGDVVRVESPQGQIEAPVYVNPAAPPDVLALPLGQGHDAYSRWAEGRGANPIDLLAPLTDEATGALAYGATRVRLVKTGRRAPLPKLEGDVPAYQLPDEESKVIKVTRG